MYRATAPLERHTVEVAKKAQGVCIYAQSLAPGRIMAQDVFVQHLL